MKVPVLAIVLLVLTAASGLTPSGVGAQEVAAVRGPRILVAPEHFDFGSVLPGKDVTREFVVRNVGTADLTIDKVQTSCGCTVVDKYSSVLKPGETTALRVKLTTPHQAGRLQKSILVRSNDPARAVVELKLEANVTAPETATRP